MDGGERDLAARVARLEAREELRDLVARYCHFADAGDFESVATLFAEDMTFSTPWGERETGRENVVGWFAMRATKFEFTYHYPHSQVVEFQDDDHASGRVQMHGDHGVDGRCARGGLRYDDTYVREDGVWRFASRHLAPLYFLGWEDMAGSFHAGALGGRPASG